MTIHIIDGPGIYLTRSEHEKFQRKYEKACQYMVDPPDFESWLVRRLGEESMSKEIMKRAAPGIAT